MLKIIFALICTQLITKSLFASEQNIIRTHDNVFLCETNSGSVEYFFNFDDYVTSTYTNSEEYELFDSESEESLSIFDENIAIINYPSLSNFVLINLDNGKKIDANDNRSNCLKISFLLRCADVYNYFGLRDESLAYKWRYISTSKESSFMSFEYLNDQNKAIVKYNDNDIFTYDFNLLTETRLNNGVISESSCKNVYPF